MKILVDEAGIPIGEFNVIQVSDDKLVCDNLEIFLNVIGIYTILENGPPGPLLNFRYENDVWVDVSPPPPPLDRQEMAKQIDSAVEAIYERPMRLSKEYEQREAAAKAYKDAGYSGPVPARVSGFATPAGMSAQAAADLILSQANQLRGALDQLSDLRMKKYQILNTSISDAETQATFDTVMANIKAIGNSIA